MYTQWDERFAKPGKYQHDMMRAKAHIAARWRVFNKNYFDGMQTTRRTFANICAPEKCLCEIIPGDAFDHGNESAINKCRL